MTARMGVTRGGGGPVAALLLVVVVPVVLAAGILVAVLGAVGAGAEVLPGGCAGGGSAQLVAGVGLDAEQVGNAHTIVVVTAGRALPAYAAVVAVATAYQESRLRNLPGGDRDSEGLFQQRISYYPRAVADDPVRATGAFLDRLVKVQNWRGIPLTVAAQAVQISAFPNAYAGWQPMATALVAQLWPTAAATAAATDAAAGPSVDLAPPLCPGGGAVVLDGGRGGTVAGTTTVPAGLVITGSPAGRTAVRFALAQLGKPFVWGAAGPDSFDCSGLTMAAWATAGVALPHWTGAQIGAGSPGPVDLSVAVGGDLVFIPGADGTPAAPRHVGMVAGSLQAPDGRHVLIVQAPKTGLPVELTDIAQWAGQIAAVRHIG